MFFSVFSFKI